MSKETALADLLKSLPDTPQLQSTDRLLAFNSQGEPKKVSRGRVSTPYLSRSLSSPQWLRVASFGSSSALMAINTVWNNNPGSRLLVDMILHSNSTSYNRITVLSRMFNSGSSNVITKLRVVVKSGSTSYLDIYYAPSKDNSVSVYFIDPGTVTVLDAFGLDAQVPDGYSVKEFDLSAVSWQANGGGVNRFSSTNYALTAQAGKGGPHESPGPHQQCTAERSLDRCNGKQKLSAPRPRRHHDSFGLLPFPSGRHGELSFRLKWLRDSMCGEGHPHGQPIHSTEVLWIIRAGVPSRLLADIVVFLEDRFLHLNSRKEVAA